MSLFRLRIRSSSIISIPILDKDTRPWGVLTIDSQQPHVQKIINVREIERGGKEYRFVFNDREVI
jgi:hypothetical protein